MSRGQYTTQTSATDNPISIQFWSLSAWSELSSSVELSPTLPYGLVNGIEYANNRKFTGVRVILTTKAESKVKHTIGIHSLNPYE